MIWIVTQLYSVVASRPTRGQPAARLSVARLQSARGPFLPGQTAVGWRGFGPRDQESALGAHLSEDTYL